MASSSNTENSISDQQVPTNLIPHISQVVIIDKDGPLIKKLKQARRETKSEEKSLLEPLLVAKESQALVSKIGKSAPICRNEWELRNLTYTGFVRKLG
ncbi:hypothetical protein RhiirC2_783235 [Rhizophagus irregularis]|uniref:Uncharacterized protein n=1 Tax=Rhizophagus irregularis TaxID=588596 RepID=A0A2N1N1B1_9GLOM|nr:hypothetical protein RhiirC2_783235 [Rhizophagus irregularis]